MTGASDKRHDQPESAENWPPDGYGHSQELPEVHWLIPIGIAVIVAIPLFMIFLSSIVQLADPWVADLQLLLDHTDNPTRELSLILRSVMGILAALLLVVTLTFVVHELVHYITNWGMGLSPEFFWAQSKFLKNPAVIAVDVGTTRLQNTTAALAPFFIIGTTGLMAWWYLDGFLASVAGIIVLVNCPSSGKDLYNAYWLARLPSGTKFATFKIESCYHSEYTVPAKTNGEGNMSEREELLENYDRADQRTKRAIINYLWENPDQEHRPENVFEAIRNECGAGTVDTVANNLSELATEDEIAHEERSFYQWPGRGNPDPNRRLRVVEKSFGEWVNSLADSKFAFLIFFGLLGLGILAGIVGLIFLFMPWDSLFRLEFIDVFIFTGLATTLASVALLMWTIIYYFEVSL